MSQRCSLHVTVKVYNRFIKEINRGGDGMMKQPIGGTNFLISIHHQENHSLQGSIHWLDTGKIIHFRSELELMNLILDATNVPNGVSDTLRKWKDSKPILSIQTS